MPATGNAANSGAVNRNTTRNRSCRASGYSQTPSICIQHRSGEHRLEQLPADLLHRLLSHRRLPPPATDEASSVASNAGRRLNSSSTSGVAFHDWLPTGRGMHYRATW